MPQSVLTYSMRSAVVGAILCGILASATRAQSLHFETPHSRQALKDVIAKAMQEASERFDIPVAWLRLVMRAESAGDAKSLSEKGAIGLMQMMPATYEELRVKHGLGLDPFDPRDNILAGAAYLAEMLGRYGTSGFLAAYNAGPRRYEEYLSGRPLPFETTDYVARLAPGLGFTSLPRDLSTASIRGAASPIFFASSAPGPSSVLLSRTAIAELRSAKEWRPIPSSRRIPTTNFLQTRGVRSACRTRQTRPPPF